MIRSYKFLLFLYLILLPVQLNVFFWPNWSFVYGSRIDYLSPALYFTDFIFVALLILAFWLQKIKLGKTYFVLGLFLFINITYSVSPAVSFYRSLKIVQAFLLFKIILNTENIYFFVRQALVWASLWVSVLAVLQVINAGSLGGVFYWLGERSFSLSKPGIAKEVFLGREFLRPYSSFSHPNVLSGFLGACFLIALPLKNTLEYFWGLLVLIVLFLGFSQAVWLGLVLALLFYKERAKKISTLFFSLSPFLLSFFLVWFSKIYYQILSINESFIRRAFLNLASVSVFSQNIWTGSGLGTFVVKLPQTYKNLSPFVNAQVYWWLQPVHNIYLLLLSETGFLFSVFVFVVLYKIISKSRLHPAILFIMFTGLFDHYWITAQQTLFLLAVVIGITIKDNESSNLL